MCFREGGICPSQESMGCETLEVKYPQAWSPLPGNLKSAVMELEKSRTHVIGEEALSHLGIIFLWLRDPVSSSSSHHEDSSRREAPQRRICSPPCKMLAKAPKGIRLVAGAPDGIVPPLLWGLPQIYNHHLIMKSHLPNVIHYSQSHLTLASNLGKCEGKGVSKNKIRAFTNPHFASAVD